MKGEMKEPRRKSCRLRHAEDQLEGARVGGREGSDRQNLTALRSPVSP